MTTISNSGEAASILADWVPFLSALVWPAFFGLVIWIFRKEVRTTFEMLRRRIASGDSISVASFSIQASRVSAGLPLAATTGVQLRPDRYDDMHDVRCKQYDRTRSIMLVHRIFRSSTPGQTFDIEVYCIPHKDGSLAGVRSVTYCFGSYWSPNTYESHNRFNGFAVVTDAWGPMMCTAEIAFADGTTAYTSRYIDFEMGAYACPTLEPEKH